MTWTTHLTCTFALATGLGAVAAPLAAQDAPADAVAALEICLDLAGSGTVEGMEGWTLGPANPDYNCFYGETGCATLQSETSGVALNLSTKGAPTFDELFCQSSFTSVGDPVAAAVAVAGLLLDEGFMADDVASLADAETHFSENGAAIEMFERCDAGTVLTATVRRRGDAPLQIGVDSEVTGC